MKVLPRHTVFSILKVGFITTMIAALMLLGVDLFTNLDSYTANQVPGKTVLVLTLLYFPEAMLLAIGPAFLFSVTYYLSMLHVSNEIMCILNSGTSYRKLLRPCIMLSVVVSVFFFVFNETVAIECSNRKSVLHDQTMGRSTSSSNNQDISLSDMYNGVMVHVGRYVDNTSSLNDVTYIEKGNPSSDGYVSLRIDCDRASWNEERQYWTFKSGWIYKQLEQGPVVVENFDTYEAVKLKFEPQLFRNISQEISTMDLNLASAYLKRIRNLNPDQYASLGTEYYKRVFSCLTPLVLMIIACSLNYRFKKNALFFALLYSICIAVVYYVVQMMTIMLASQGVIAPELGTLIPFAAIIALTSILSLALKG